MNKLKFEELNLSSELEKAVSDMGFEYMSPIQEAGIPKMLKGIDIVGQAQTGTGKTAAFGLPLLEKCNPRDKAVQAIVLCPTRELSIQVADEIEKLGKYKQGVKVLPIYGGQPIGRQINALKKGVQIVVGTPGRVIDHIQRRTLKLGGVNMVVLDEADEMFDMGFRDDIEIILKETPKERQTVFFSATMPKEMVRFTKMYQRDSQLVKVVSKKLTGDNIEQAYFNVKQSKKLDALIKLVEMHEPELSIVFCNTKKMVDHLTEDLEAHGYLADGLHGDLSQPQRDRVMNKFRNGNINILVATDVAARGIDVDDVDLVINYDMPQDDEYYVHRIGRTGRAGRQGLAFSLVTGKDKRRVKDIERYSKMKIKKAVLPTDHDIEKKLREKLLTNIEENIKEDLKDEKKIIKQLMDKGHDIEDISSSLLKLYLDSLNTKVKAASKEVIESEGQDRLYISTGRRMGVKPNHILAAIMETVNMPKDGVGKIDIYDKFSFVNVSTAYSRDVVSNLNNKKIKGRKVSVEFAKS